MNDRRRMRSTIADAVAGFAARTMALSPRAVAVELHPPDLLVVLRGAVCVGERELARNQAPRERLARLYAEAFEVSRRDLEATVFQALGQPVIRSGMHLDCMSGDVILTFVIGERPSIEASRPNADAPEGRSASE